MLRSSGAAAGMPLTLALRLFLWLGVPLAVCEVLLSLLRVLLLLLLLLLSLDRCKVPYIGCMHDALYTRCQALTRHQFEYVYAGLSRIPSVQRRCCSLQPVGACSSCRHGSQGMAR